IALASFSILSPVLCIQARTSGGPESPAGGSSHWVGFPLGESRPTSWSDVAQVLHQALDLLGEFLRLRALLHLLGPELLGGPRHLGQDRVRVTFDLDVHLGDAGVRSEEQTSELQSRENLVGRLLLEKKKKQ